MGLRWAARGAFLAQLWVAHLTAEPQDMRWRRTLLAYFCRKQVSHVYFCIRGFSAPINHTLYKRGLTPIIKFHFQASANQSSGIVDWQLWSRESLIKLWQFWSILLWYAVKQHRGRSVDVRRKLKDLRRYWRHQKQQRRLEDLSEKRKTRMLSVMQLLCKYGARLNVGGYQN